MAANSPINYISLSDTFLTHWAQVNTALAPKALTLKAGYTHASLQADRNAFAITLTDIINADNNVQGARARRDAQQSVLKERLRQFRNAVLAQLSGTEPVAQLPIIPNNTAATSHWSRALDDVASIWLKIETAPPSDFTNPLTLADGYTRAQFASDLAALKATYTAVIAAEGSATVLRKTRTVQATAIRTRLVAYRKAVVGAFAAGHPLLASLPGL